MECAVEGEVEKKAEICVFTQNSCTMLPELSVRRSACNKYEIRIQQPQTEGRAEAGMRLGSGGTGTRNLTSQVSRAFWLLGLVKAKDRINGRNTCKIFSWEP